MSSLVFIAIPYSHPDPAVKHERIKGVAQMIVKMLQQGIFAFSPITYGIALIQNSGSNLLDDWKTWEKACKEYMKGCSKMYVINLPGWELSSGVKGEIEEAKNQGKQVDLIEFDTDPNTPIKILLNIHTPI